MQEWKEKVRNYSPNVGFISITKRPYRKTNKATK
jgi:hypothetical protein